MVTGKRNMEKLTEFVCKSFTTSTTMDSTTVDVDGIDEPDSGAVVTADGEDREAVVVVDGTARRSASPQSPRCSPQQRSSSTSPPPSAGPRAPPLPPLHLRHSPSSPPSRRNYAISSDGRYTHTFLFNLLLTDTTYIYKTLQIHIYIFKQCMHTHV